MLNLGGHQGGNKVGFFILSMSDYSEKLKNPRWQKKRLEILNRDNFMCRCCGDYENKLNVHHIIYPKNKNPWDIENYCLITLCDYCHEMWHYIFDSKYNNDLICHTAKLHSDWEYEDIMFNIKKDS